MSFEAWWRENRGHLAGGSVYECASAAWDAAAEACAAEVQKRRIADECADGQWDRGYNMALTDLANAINAR